MIKMELEEIFKKRTRHPFRPRASDIIDKLFPDFQPVKTEGISLIIGTCEFKGKLLYIIGQQKPKPDALRSKEDLKQLNYGMLTAEDHSQVLRFLKHCAASDRENSLVFCLVDTYGADISMESARHFQAFFIAHLIREFLTIPVRTTSLVLGEGGSGGALAIQFTDIRGQMDDALYATAPPESMASIVFRDSTRIKDALMILKPTAKELLKLNVINRIVTAPEDVTDCEAMAESVRRFLDQSIGELFRSPIRKLMKKREMRAKSFGLSKKEGKLHDFRRYIELPLKKAFFKPPANIKVVHSSDMTEIADDYGIGFAHFYGIVGKTKTQEEDTYIECGGLDSDSKQFGGCGRLVPLRDFLQNFHVCPFCGRVYTIGAEGWIDCLSNQGSFHELYRNLTVDQLMKDEFITDNYRDFLARQEKRSHFKESLVVGSARIYQFNVVMAISEFYYCGGSMGVVFGEKFRRAVDYAIHENLPVVSVCCSGGARLYEGISALMQMVKTVESVNRLKKQGLPFISILADPATGGAIASYAALGDVTIAEPGALVIFAGPRVMKSSGFEVNEKLVRSDSLHVLSSKIHDSLNFYHDIRGIQEVCERKNMKATVGKYLEFYARTNSKGSRKADRRPRT